MELDEFVASVLTKIVKGAEAAQEKCVSSGATISPIPRYHDNEGRAGLLTDDFPPRLIQPVRFDVALTTVDQGAASGSVRIAVAHASLGSTASETMVSRVQFDVPLALPSRRGGNANKA